MQRPLWQRLQHDEDSSSLCPDFQQFLHVSYYESLTSISRVLSAWAQQHAASRLNCALRCVCTLFVVYEGTKIDICNGGILTTFLRRGRSLLDLVWWNMMILIFFIIFGARSLTRVILAFGEHNHQSGNWLQKWWKRSKSLCAPWGLELQSPW